MYIYKHLYYFSIRTFQVSEGFMNSIIMHVILSAPIPSDAARFIGHILSIIISIILESYTGLLAGLAEAVIVWLLDEEALVEWDLERDETEAEFVDIVFFGGEVAPLRYAAVPTVC